MRKKAFVKINSENQSKSVVRTIQGEMEKWTEGGDSLKYPGAFPVLEILLVWTQVQSCPHLVSGDNTWAERNPKRGGVDLEGD